VSGWTNPWIAMMVMGSGNGVGTSNVPDYADIKDQDVFVYGAQAGATMKFFCSAEGFDNVTDAACGQRFTTPNTLDGNGFHIGGMGLSSMTTSLIGRHGEVFDLFWGQLIPVEGNHYPATLPREFVQLGDCVHPWNGAADGQMLLS
jgi:hypothetical protein